MIIANSQKCTGYKNIRNIPILVLKCHAHTFSKLKYEIGALFFINDIDFSKKSKTHWSLSQKRWKKEISKCIGCLKSNAFNTVQINLKPEKYFLTFRYKVFLTESFFLLSFSISYSFKKKKSMKFIE